MKASRTCTPLAALVLRLPPGQLRGHTRPANDTWIAASCLARQLPLATLQPQGFRRPRRAREAGDRTDSVTRAWSRMRQADHPWHGSWHGSWHEHGDIRKGAKDRRDLVKAPGENSGTLERMPGPGLRRRERRFESCRGHQPAKGMRRSNAHQGAAAGGEPANAQVTGSQCGCPWGIGHRTVRPVAAEGPDAVIVVRRSARNTAAGAQPSTILHISATRDLPHDAPQSARRTPSDEHG